MRGRGWRRPARASARAPGKDVMIERSRPVVASVLVLLVLSGPGLAFAQVFIYPSRGQSAQQEQFDRGQCYSWAVQQSGFDPANPQVYTPPPPPPGAPQGGLFRGAAGGAAMGAVGGAIGGDAGKGAAIGAAVGGLFGLMRRARWAEEQRQQQQSYMAQQQNAAAQGRANYNRAFSTCMTARGYSVSM
jgi:hypothetical protein